MREGCSVWRADNVSLASPHPEQPQAARSRRRHRQGALHPPNKTGKSAFLLQGGMMG